MYEAQKDSVTSVPAGTPLAVAAAGIINELRTVQRCIGQYMYRTARNRPAFIDRTGLVIGRLLDMQGFCGSYCPVSWAERRELVDTRNSQLYRRYAVEFQRRVYHCASLQDAIRFQASPFRFLLNQKFPAVLPERVPASVGAELRVQELAMNGLCPVLHTAAHDGDATAFGSSLYVVNYDRKMFALSSEAALHRFMRSPWRFVGGLQLRPPISHSSLAIGHVDLSSALSTAGRLYHSLGDRILAALMALAESRAELKHPALSADRSALMFVALQLYASSPHVMDTARRHRLAGLKVRL